MVALQQLNQLIPNPDTDIFCRRHGQNIIQAGVVQMRQHLVLHQILQLNEINNHTLVVGSELPQVFRMSKINLNFTIPNIKSGIPLRVWDVLGAGGFLMTNYQAEIPYYFKEGEDLVCFDGINDLCEKAEYYLAHEEERLAIAENGYRKVREHHNYIERINTMLDIIEENENQENDI